MVRQIITIFQRVRGVALTLIYAVIALISLHLAYQIRFDFNLPGEVRHEIVRVLWLLIPIKLLALIFTRQMGSLVTFFGISDFIRLSLALLVSAVLLLIPRLTDYGQFSPPRGVLLIDFLVCLAAFCSFRLGARLFRERILIGQKMRGRRFEKVVIVGAGDAGASLVSHLLNMPARGLRPVAFLDDDTGKHQQFIHGIEVVGKTEEFTSLPCLEGIRHAIIAMPSASPKRVGEIALFLGRLGVQVETVPALEDLASGKVRVGGIRPIEIQDLLGRPVVDLDTSSIRRFIESKVVLVTGAGGSIGTELCRQISHLNPQRLLMVEQSEASLFLCEQEMNELGMGAIATPVVADILDERRMTDLFARMRPQVVFHAAAHKHVYLMERQPGEAIRNNSVGTRLLGEIAARSGVEAFVLISTDKAINPTNVMGASKRLAEINLQAIHARSRTPVAVKAREATHKMAVKVGRGSQEVGSASSVPLARAPGAQAEGDGRVQQPTKFVAVRFGNVLGSSGSVVPIFKRQIAAGGPVTVTHPDVTRYFMTIPEAVGLVMQAAVLGTGGEIFVLDMGQPVKISDLARQMIELSGFKVGEDIEIKFTGLKPGEKLYEELQHHDESHQPTEHPRIMRFISRGNADAASAQAIDQLEPILYTASANMIKQQLQVIVPEYSPHFE